MPPDELFWRNSFMLKIYIYNLKIMGMGFTNERQLQKIRMFCDMQDI